MTLEEFGQTVKQKHPEYGDMSDADVGTKVIQKYPQYNDMVSTGSTQPQNTQGNVLSNIPVLGGLLNTFSPQLTKTVGSSIEGIGRSLGEGADIIGANTFYNPQQKQEAGQRFKDYTSKLTQLKSDEAPQSIGKAALEGAAWTSPLSAESWLARLGLGAGQGTLQGLSQEGANPQSVATSAVVSGGLNAILPGLATALSSVLGRTSLGKGGELLPQLTQATGKPLMGSAKDISGNMFEYTAPLRDELSTMLKESPDGISQNEIFKKLDDIASTMGVSQQAEAQQYIQALKERISKEALNAAGSSTSDTASSVLDTLTHLSPNMESIVQSEGSKGGGGLVRRGSIQGAGKNFTPLRDALDPNAFSEVGGNTAGAAPKFGTPNAGSTGISPTGGSSSYTDAINKELEKALPLDFWNNIKQIVGSDVENKWQNIQAGKFVPAQHDVASQLYGALKTMIADRSGNADQVTNLNKLLQAATNIKSGINQRASGGGGIEQLARTWGLPAELLTALVSHNPAITPAAIAQYIATHATTATPIASGLASDQAKTLLQFLTRISGGAVGGQLDNKTQ